MVIVMSYYEETAFELPISYCRYAIAMVLEEDLLSRRNVWASFLQEVEEKIVGDGTSDLFRQVCVYAKSSLSVHGLRAGWAEGRAFDGFHRSMCESDCETNAGSSEPNVHYCPRHLQPHLCLAGMERGWLSLSLSSLAALIGSRRKVLPLMSFPSLGCCFSLQILCTGRQKSCIRKWSFRNKKKLFCSDI